MWLLAQLQIAANLINPGPAEYSPENKYNIYGIPAAFFLLFSQCIHPHHLYIIVFKRNRKLESLFQT